VSKGPENTFISSVHRYLPDALYKMKNHNQYNGGIADVWYSGVRADLWVEYKYLDIPKRDDTVIDLTDLKKPYCLSALQQDWLSARHKEGRNVGVIVGSKDGGVWLPGVGFDKCMPAKTFVNALKSRRELAELIALKTYG
jgi:hypothetical protein